MKFFFVSFFLFFSYAIAWGQNAEQMAFINSEQRPDVESLIANPRFLEDFPTHSYAGKKTTNHYNKDIPSLIIALEKAFPGGTYAFLGRDTELLADALEGFYLKIGQTNRIARVRLSTPSFAGFYAPLFVEYLEQLGLSRPTHPFAHTFVLIDVTSFGGNSQSYYLTEAVIASYLASGIAPDEISHRFNLAIFDRGTAANTADAIDTSDQDLTRFLDAQANDIIQYKLFNHLVALPGKDLSYNSEWHGKYGRIERLSNGRLTTNPASYNSRADKTYVFHGILTALRTTTSTQFIEKTVNMAKRYGVELTQIRHSQTLTPAQPPLTAAEINQRYVDALASLNLQPLPEGYDYDNNLIYGEKIKLTSNGTNLYSLMSRPEHLLADDYLAISVKSLVMLYEHHLIGARDFRRIFISLLNKKTIPLNTQIFPFFNHQNFTNYILSLTHLEPVRILLDRPREREKYMRMEGLAGSNYFALVDQGRRPVVLTCNDLFAEE